MKKTLLTILAITLTVTLGTQVVKAIGSLTPSGTAGDATQYTLNDIYTRLTTGTSTSTKSGMFSVPGSMSATFYTLSEIYNAIPATLSLSNSTTTVPVGINRATTTLSLIDTDLIATNIATGTSIFGVAGTLPVFPTQLSVGTTTPITWATAVSYCGNLIENTHTDWRLPSYIELVNEYLTNGQGSFQSGYYWSSTELPSSPSVAYSLHMLNGYASNDVKTLPSLLARCVR